MEYLARKIARAKWDPKPGLPPEAIRADAITGCLRTTNDTLSVWECDGTLLDIAEVALALAAQGNTLDKLDIVLLKMSDLEARGIALTATPGETPVTDLRARHRDLANLDMVAHGSVAVPIATLVRARTDHYSFTRRRVLELLGAAIDSGRVSSDALAASLRMDIEKVR
jgi:hypothetical protein